MQSNFNTCFLFSSLLFFFRTTIKGFAPKSGQLPFWSKLYKLCNTKYKIDYSALFDVRISQNQCKYTQIKMWYYDQVRTANNNAEVVEGNN